MTQRLLTAEEWWREPAPSETCDLLNLPRNTTRVAAWLYMLGELTQHKPVPQEVEFRLMYGEGPLDPDAVKAALAFEKTFLCDGCASRIQKMIERLTLLGQLPKKEFSAEELQQAHTQETQQLKQRASQEEARLERDKLASREAELAADLVDTDRLDKKKVN